MVNALTERMHFALENLDVYHYVNHPLMNISAAEVEANLKKYFRIVRLLNVYDAYSSGYRANFVCYS